jgi:hypothetical protein
MHFHVFEATLDELQGKRHDKNGKVSTGVRYCPEVMQQSLTLLRDCDEKTYDTFAEILNLPSRRHARKKFAKEVDEDGDGNCWKMTSKEVNIWSNWAKKNPGISHGWDKVGIGYDSCEIAKGIIMKTRKSSMLRLSGVVMPETQDAATVLFEKFILRVKQERGMGPCEGDQLETVNEMLTRNTQHSVYYVTSLNPDCKMCFIGAVYNTPTLNMGLISDHLDELKMGLSEMGLSVVFEVLDSAGCNAGYANRASNIAAKEFIPADILAMHGLDGECLVAFRQQADGTVTFQLDDPPHVLKRVVGAAHNHPLSWEWNATMNRPMSVDALRDVYYASLTGRGELTLAWHRKMTPDLFAKTDRVQTMKVAPAAKLLSNTMVTIIDKVCNDPNIPLETVSYGSRKQLYSKARELCMNMNGFFDVCNSKQEAESS